MHKYVSYQTCQYHRLGCYYILIIHQRLYGTRSGTYHWKTYAEIGALVTAFGSGLVKLATEHTQQRLTYGTHWKLALYSVNREEWCIAEHGAHAYGLASVALCNY